MHAFCDVQTAVKDHRRFNPNLVAPLTCWSDPHSSQHSLSLMMTPSYSHCTGVLQAAVKDYKLKREAGKPPAAAMAEVKQEQAQAPTA